MALQYAQIRAETFDLATQAQAPALTPYSCVLLCAEMLQVCDKSLVRNLAGHVASGGGLAVIFRGWNRDLADLFGVDCDDEWPGFLDRECGGLEFASDLVPELHGLRLSCKDVSGHTPYDFSPDDNVTVVARACDGRPLAWLNTVHLGRVLFWNTSVLAERDMRGLVVQSVALVQAVSVVAAANVGLIQIDDFPPPWVSELPPRLQADYPGFEPVDFFERVWLPDMAALAREHDLKYTCFGIVDYDAGIGPEPEAPPFPLSLAGRLARYGPVVGRSSPIAELGLHGYNHVPPLVSHWGSREAMLAGFRACRAHWEDDVGADLPRSYVPPNNEYDEAGLDALHTAFPEIGAICSVHSSGSFERGGHREFGPEPWNERLFCIPRQTSGFEMAPYERFQAVSQLLTMGAWTHFVHPDDLFDTPERSEGALGQRNPLDRPWRSGAGSSQDGLFDRFSDWTLMLRERFPWLRFLSTAAASSHLRTFMGGTMTAHLGRMEIVVESERPLCVRLRINDLRQLNPASLRNAQLVHVQQGPVFRTYTIETLGGTASVELI